MRGSSQCTDQYFAMIKSEFDTFSDPLVYTPGDNEWTDCHRANNGSFNPLERLAAVRSVFFPQPGVTFGKDPIHVQSQAAQCYVEYVSYTRAGVAFAAVHIIGSNNSLAPWTGNTGAGIRGPRPNGGRHPAHPGDLQSTPATTRIGLWSS
jgi:hypothetical protein